MSTKPSVHLLALLLTAAAATANAQDAEPRFSLGAEVATAWQSNIGFTPDDNDKFDVFTTRIKADLGYAFVQRQGLELVGTLSPFYQYVTQVADLSNFGATAGLDLRGEFGAGFTDPWYSIGVDYTVAGYDDSDPREGEWLELELAIGKRFTPLFGLSGGYRYFKRWQDDDDPECLSPFCGIWFTDEVFDHNRNGAFIHGDLFLRDKTSLFAEYTYWDGDVASTGFAARPNTAVTDDLAFEGIRLPNGTVTEYTVWRADADQHVAEMGVTHSFTERLSVEMSALYLWTTDVDSIISDEDYENGMVTLTIRFDNIGR